MAAYPLTPYRKYRSLIISHMTEILLETDEKGFVCGLILDELREWIAGAKKGNNNEFTLNETFKVNPLLRTLFIRGYKIEESPRRFICTHLATKWLVISLKGDEFQNVITGLEYIYHMDTCV